MNNGKICISVCAETVNELIAEMKQADDLADVIEMRFDCLSENEFNPRDSAHGEKVFGAVLNGNSLTSEIILTFRPREQGGRRKISLNERHDFWDSGFDGWAADLEEDVFELSTAWRYSPRICSHHDFDGVPNDLNEIYDRISARDLVDVIKIAVQANDITDTIPLWKLLQKAKSDNRQIIPVAMGEAGKWTRILGLAHGAFMTYASLDADSETAPGQITAADMLEVYRIKELDENTDVYGIVASDTSYSVSPWMHNAAFRAAELNSVFVPLQVADLGDFMRRMVKPETREVELNFKGFSVTNPHKQSMIRHLDLVDETAQKIGAVNTVKIDDGKFYGYNTDAPGFIAPLKKTFDDLKGASVAVIGAGGAARACIYSLQQEGAKVTLIARDVQKAAGIATEFGIGLLQLATDDRPLTTVFDIIVNATPLGTRGQHEDKTAMNAEQLKNVKLVYDLIYNPAETRLIKEARLAGAETIGGLEMLIAQGAKQFEIWTGRNAPIDEMSAAVKKRLNL